MTSPIVSGISVPDNIIDLFWSLVDRRGDDECWPWLGGKNAAGYGQLSISGKTVGAHRLSFVLNIGPIPDDAPHVLHKCDNPPCCNPRDLYAGTPADNMRDKVDRGRHRNGNQAGEHNPQSRLSDAAVALLRQRRASGASTQLLAAELGVSVRTVQDAVRGVTWSHVETPAISINRTAKLDANDVVAIRRACAYQGRTRASLAAAYGVSESLINNIVRGQKWARAGGPLIVARIITEIIHEQDRTDFSAEDRS